MLSGLRDRFALHQRYKPMLRDGWARALSACHATSPARFARGALSVVTFHRVLPDEQLRAYPMPGLAVTPTQLEEVVGHLARHFHCTTLIDAYRHWGSERFATSKRPLLAVTFDDGALDNYENARPVLARLGVRASFYVPVGNVEEGQAPWHDRLGFALLRTVAAVQRRPEVDFQTLLAPFGIGTAELQAVLPVEAASVSQRGVQHSKALTPEQRSTALARLEAALGEEVVPAWAGMMSWEQVRELAAEGHEVGSHSMTHALLPDCDDRQLRREIAESRERLLEVTGSEVASFCYPNGSYDRRCLAEVRAAGYECAVTTSWGINPPSRIAPFELRRCDMDFARLVSRLGAFSPDRLMLRLSGLQPGLAPGGAPSGTA